MVYGKLELLNKGKVKSVDNGVKAYAIVVIVEGIIYPARERD